MGLFSKMNHSRMKLMRKTFKDLGADKTSNKGKLLPEDVKRVFISRPNGRLGNLLLISPLIQEVTALFPNCKIDIFVKGRLAPVLFENYPSVDRIISLPKKPFSNLPGYIWQWISLQRYRYDLAINAVDYSSSGRLSTQFVRARFKFFGKAAENEQLKYIDHKHIAKNPVYDLRPYLRKTGMPVTDGPIALLDLKLTTQETANGKALLDNLTGNDKPTIALFTYATGRKMYSPEWWQVYYERLRSNYHDHNFIEILPIENVSQLGFRISSFYSRDIREIGSVIANTKLFIGADSGIMHLASAVHTPTIGLFSVSNAATYRPYGNNSIGINTNTTTMQQWLMAVDCILAGKTLCREEQLPAMYSALRPA
jgi:ADP-heptose:LPS heptosyltransferase